MLRVSGLGSLVSIGITGLGFRLRSRVVRHTSRRV